MGDKMKCLNCRNKIIIHRNILNLFSFKKEYVCKECFKISKFNPNQIILPINNFNLVIQYLLENNENFTYECLHKENLAILNKISKYNFFILHFNRFYFKEESYYFLEQLANHHQKNILLYVYVVFD